MAKKTRRPRSEAVPSATRPFFLAPRTKIVATLDKAGQRPLIDSTFAFEDCHAAFGRLNEGPLGKVVLAVGAG